MNRMKKGNLITASICCGVGLALIGTGIYYLTTGSRLTGGVIIGLGLAICAMFVVTLVMMRKFDRLKADADAKYEEAGRGREDHRRSARKGAFGRPIPRGNGGDGRRRDSRREGESRGDRPLRSRRSPCRERGGEGRATRGVDIRSYVQMRTLSGEKRASNARFVICAHIPIRHFGFQYMVICAVSEAAYVRSDISPRGQKTPARSEERRARSPSSQEGCGMGDHPTVMVQMSS